jgi:hypothetical protein
MIIRQKDGGQVGSGFSVRHRYSGWTGEKPRRYSGKKKVVKYESGN